MILKRKRWVYEGLDPSVRVLKEILAKVMHLGPKGWAV